MPVEPTPLCDPVAQERLDKIDAKIAELEDRLKKIEAKLEKINNPPMIA